MSDIISEALRKHRNTQEREAEGTVNGKNVTIRKHKMLLRWKLSIIVEGELTKRQSGNAASVDSDFRYYVDQYDLEEKT